MGRGRGLSGGRQAGRAGHTWSEGTASLQSLAPRAPCSEGPLLRPPQAHGHGAAASGAQRCPHTPHSPRGWRPSTWGCQGPRCSHSVAEPGGDSPRWHCLPVKPERQAQVYEGLPVTQSSMHVPPLRHGRRARHTEAADTGPSRAVTPFPPRPEGPTLRSGPSPPGGRASRVSLSGSVRESPV